jgi:hypothetical protein
VPGDAPGFLHDVANGFGGGQRIIERTETKIDRALLDAARARAAKKGRGEAEVIEEAVKRYLETYSGGIVGLLDKMEEGRQRRGRRALRRRGYEARGGGAARLETRTARTRSGRWRVMAVVDPNVLVSAALSKRRAPWELVRLWREGAFELVVSHDVLFELQSV